MGLPTKRQLYERSRESVSVYKADLRARVAKLDAASYEDALEIMNAAARFAAQIAATDDMLSQAKAA